MIHKKPQSVIAVILIPILMFSSLIAVGQATSAQSASLLPNVPKTNAAIQQNYGQLPLSFVPNAGQTDQAVHFQVNSLGGTLFFTPQEVVLSLPQARRNTDSADIEQRVAMIEADAQTAIEPPLVVKMQLIGANATAEIAGADPLPGIVNYFIGNDPSQWHSNVPTYAGIVYRDVYPGIDLQYDGHEGRLKGTYTVAAGVDPSVIRWRYEGNAGLSVDQATGDLLIALANGNVLREIAPTAWQEKAGKREAVETRYIVDGEEVRFNVTTYDTKLPFVIDPTFEYATYLGGYSDDSGTSIAVDSAGYAYVTGQTQSSNFPIANALQANIASSWDAFVMKLTPTGSLSYSTYLGGTNNDFAEDIAVDTTGSTYVVGTTSSANFPIANAAQVNYAGGSDIFVTKLSATGATLSYSTYLGGASEEVALSVALDVSSAAYVTGRTSSIDFPTLNPVQSTFGGGSRDVFVTKLMPSGSSLSYSTYLGGSLEDQGYSIDVDSTGAAYIAGYTYSTDFPTMNALQENFSGGSIDGFVAKLTSTGSNLSYSSFLGGNDDDVAIGIAVDSTGSAYVTGQTASDNFPTTNALQPSRSGHIDIFVTKLLSSGTSLSYSTYLGGANGQSAFGIAVDSGGYAYITGWTGSTDFPTTHALQGSPGGGIIDAIVSKLNPAGNSLIYSTYLGGSGLDYGYGIAIFGSNAYITGWTESTNFPASNAFQVTNAGHRDAFAVKISDADLSTATPTPSLTNTPEPSVTSTVTTSPNATATQTATTTTSTTPSPTSTSPSTHTVTPSVTFNVAAPHPDTIGIFRPLTTSFYMRNSNTTGYADSSITFGATTDFPIAGDWDGDGIDTVGVYRQSTGQFYLTNSTANPAALSYSFVLGSPGDQPIVGDWDGDGRDGVGVFRPSNGLIYLKNSLTTGFADFTMVLGSPGDVGIAGDWNGDGKDSPGVYRPSNQVFYLSNAICNCSVFADAELGLGIAGDTPFVGDWDGDGKSGVGVYRQSNGLTYIKNALTTGFADASFVFGSANDYPLAGYWVRVSPPAVEAAPTFQPAN